VPDADESVTHAALAEAVHKSVPPPAFVIETLCAPGTAPPAVELNVSAWGEATKEAGAVVTVSVTATVTALLDAPAADI
jgi:hypothetical protein